MPETAVRLSFRDPAGRLHRCGGRILREIEPEATKGLLRFLHSPTNHRLVAQGRLIQSRILAEIEQRTLPIPLREGALLVEHPEIDFPSFPYEWCPEMLLAAGRATIDLALDLLPAGLGLKDASAYNLLFDGHRPVFIDILSVEERTPGDSTWLPYAQFQRHFVLPLLAGGRLGLRLAQTFLCSRDGLEPETVYPLVGPLRRLLPPLLGLVSLPTWLGRRRGGYDPAVYRPAPSSDAEKARFILTSTLRHLRRQLQTVAPRQRDSTWSGYMESKSYSTASFGAKDRFVHEALEQLRPARVLDVGCNTGHFSLMAARAGASVVAIDSDPAVLDSVYRAAAGADLSVLPLAVDLSSPSPPFGWRCEERASFLSRAKAKFDLVLALAVLHHLLVTDRVPLDDVLDLFAELTRDAAVIEFVEPADPMFRRLARGRDSLFGDLNRQSFETACSRRFEIVRSTGPLDGTRWLYLLRRKGDGR